MYTMFSAKFCSEIDLWFGHGILSCKFTNFLDGYVVLFI